MQNIESIKYQNHLELELQSSQSCQTICNHQYTTYPLRLSPIFRLEGKNSNRAYLYLINTSPGLLAKDELNLSLQLSENTNLYLTDQAATKVHPMPEINSKASINYEIIVNKDSSLELLPEPVILYEDSVLEQNTTVKLDSTAKLFLTEIILPGRLAKEEYYDFRYYYNRLQITDLTGKLLFTDAMHLEGKNNLFKDNHLFTSMPIMGNAIAVLPDTDIDLLTSQLENIELTSCKNIEIATTILPGGNGIMIRSLAHKTLELKKYFVYVLNCIRLSTNQASLPPIPK